MDIEELLIDELSEDACLVRPDCVAELFSNMAPSVGWESPEEAIDGDLA